MKFEVFQSPKNKQFYFNLKAKNGQVILSSEGYSDKSGAKNGAKAVARCAAKDDLFDRKVAKNGKSYFNLCSTNGQIVGKSQMYASKATCEKGVASVKRVAPTAIIVERD